MVIWIDGFDAWSASDLQVRYRGATGVSISASGRTGSCLHIASGSSYLQGQNLASAQTTWIFGFAFKWSGSFAGSTAAGCSIIQLANSSGTGTLQLFLKSTGAVQFYSSGNAIAGGSASTTTLAQNTWYYLEVKLTISASTQAGDLQCYLDGVKILDGPTGVATNGISAVSYFLGFPGATSGNVPTFDIDDFYIVNPASGSNTTFLGNCKVETVRPSGAGASAQWTPKSGANYTQVQDTTEDGDTTYVSTAGVGNRDSYAVGALSSHPASIYAVGVTAVARVDASETTRTASVSVRSGGSYSDSAAMANSGATAIPSAYTTRGASINGFFDTDPSGSAWTYTTVTGLEAGVKLVA